jgi:hypothetical protein
MLTHPSPALRPGAQYSPQTRTIFALLNLPSLAGCKPQLVAAFQVYHFELRELACQLLDTLPPHTLAPHAPALARQLLSSDVRSELVSTLARLDLSADPDI